MWEAEIFFSSSCEAVNRLDGLVLLSSVDFPPFGGGGRSGKRGCFQKGRRCLFMVFMNAAWGDYGLRERGDSGENSDSSPPSTLSVVA